MNHMTEAEYVAFLRTQAWLETSAGRFFERLRILDPLYTERNWSRVCFSHDGVEIRWYWQGPYGACDDGWYLIPFDAFLRGETWWDDYIKTRCKTEQDLAVCQRAEAAALERQKRIHDAKAVLREEGILDDLPENDVIRDKP